MSYVNPTMQPDGNQPPDPPTWESHYLIPIVQNITGGAAVSLLGFIGVIAYTGAVSEAIDLYNAGVWCALGGGIVACVITVIRFFGDDLGLLQSAYNAGYHARDAQIAALELELRASYDAQTATQAKGGAAAEISERKRMMMQAAADAKLMIKVHFQRDSIGRDQMKERGVGQRNWERANWLLKASGVMNNDGVIIAASPKIALDAIEERLEVDLQTNEKFVPKW